MSHYGEKIPNNTAGGRIIKCHPLDTPQLGPKRDARRIPESGE